jgi:hypothetical protein
MSRKSKGNGKGKGTAMEKGKANSWLNAIEPGLAHADGNDTSKGSNTSKCKGTGKSKADKAAWLARKAERLVDMRRQEDIRQQWIESRPRREEEYRQYCFWQGASVANDNDDIVVKVEADVDAEEIQRAVQTMLAEDEHQYQLWATKEQWATNVLAWCVGLSQTL